MFANLTIVIYAHCEEYCVREKECVSVNIGPVLEDTRICELSRSDALQHPQELKKRVGWIYRATEVRKCKSK